MEKVDEEERQIIKLEDVNPPKEVGGKDEEKHDADGLAESEAPVNKLEETAGIQTNLPASVDVEKVVDVLVEAYSEKIENCAPKPESLSAPKPESLSAPGQGDEAVQTLSGEPEKQCVVVEKGDNPPLEDLPAEVNLKVVESSVLDPESDSAPKLDEKPEEHSVDVQKVEDDVPIVDTPTETGSKEVENPVQRKLEAPEGDTTEVDDASVADVLAETGSKEVENPVLDPESLSASEPGGEIVERKLETPEGGTTEVDDASVADFLAEAGSKMVENSILETESSPTEPIAVAVEKLSEENPTMVEKVDDATVVGVPCKASLEMVEDSVVDSELSSASKPEEHPVEVEKVDTIPVVYSSIEAESLSSSAPGGETVQRQLEVTKEHLSTEIVETQQQEQVAAEAVEQLEEKPSIGTAEPGSSIEAVDKPVEHLEVIPVKESELEVAKQPEASSEAECKIAVDKPEEHLEAIAVKDSELEVAKVAEASSEAESKVAESPGLVPKLEEETGERAKVIKGVKEEIDGTMADKCEVKESLKEEETSLDQEPVAYENSVTTNQEAQIDPKEEEGDSSNSSDVIEKAFAEPMGKEGSGSEVVERLSKDETVVAAKVEEENEEKNVKVEDSEGKSTKVEESIQTEAANFVAEVAEVDREQVSREVEVVAEMKKMEDVKEDTPLSVEADKDKDGQVKLSEQETVKNNADNLESAKEDSEKSDPPSVETLKNGDDTKTSAKPPKQDDSVKKHSNNLMSKVKQSIVKVKKAIIGKSPSSKALQPEAKKVEKAK